MYSPPGSELSEEPWLYLATQWHEMMQANMFTKLNQDPSIPRVISGDGRIDFPGHSAQYCSYTFMLDNLHYVLHTELIDKRMTGLRSPNMELEGMVRGLDLLKKELKVVEVNGVIRKIELVTDAHPQIVCKLDVYFLLISPFIKTFDLFTCKSFM